MDKVEKLFGYLTKTNSEYVDDLYLLISFLNEGKEIRRVVEELIDISERPYLQYIADEQDAEFLEWVSFFIGNL